MSNWINKINRHEVEVPGFLWSAIATNLDEADNMKNLVQTGKRLYNYEVKPPKNIWYQIVHELNGKKTQSKISFLKWSVYSAAAACLALLVYFNFFNSTKPDNTSSLAQSIESLPKVSNTNSVVANVKTNDAKKVKEEKINTNTAQTNQKIENQSKKIDDITYKYSTNAVVSNEKPTANAVKPSIYKTNISVKERENVNLDPDLASTLNTKLKNSEGRTVVAEFKPSSSNTEISVGPMVTNRTNSRNVKRGRNRLYDPQKDEKIDDIIINSKNWKLEAQGLSKKISQNLIVTPNNMMGIFDLLKIVEGQK